MTRTIQAAPPTDDKRWRIVEATMRRNGYRPEALIETLHTVQESFGFLDDASLRFVSGALGVSPSTAYGVATFYHYFQLKPQGEHSCSICLGTACYIKGAQKLLEFMKSEYGIVPGETTPDNRLSALSVRCLGACGLAPAVVVDGEVVGEVTVDAMQQRLKEVVES